MVRAESDRECRGLSRVALQLGVLDAAAAPPDLMHRREAARRLDDAVSTDAIGAHLPAQLDEQPMRVGVLLFRAVELCHALGRLLAAQAHAMQELLDPAFAGTDVESLCVEPFVHQASDPHCAEAQDVGHPAVSSNDSKVLLQSGASAGALRFHRYGVFGLISSNIPGHSRWTSAKQYCMSHRRSVFH